MSTLESVFKKVPGSPSNSPDSCGRSLNFQTRAKLSLGRIARGHFVMLIIMGHFRVAVSLAVSK